MLIPPSSDSWRANIVTPAEWWCNILARRDHQIEDKRPLDLIQRAPLLGEVVKTTAG